MFRIDDPTAAAELPAFGPAGTPGYFTGGDPAQGVPPTTVTQDFMNGVQEEFMSVLAAAAIAPDKGNHGQLLAAMIALLGVTGDPGVPIFKLSNGVIVQVGFADALANQAQHLITFTTPFPTACLWMCASLGTSLTLTSSNISVGAAPVSKTQGQLAIAATSAGTTGINWIAIGH